MKYEELITKNQADLVTIGERIRKRRKELGLTQLDLAIASGYARSSSIQKIESGSRNLPTAQLESIAKALFVSSSFLCGNETYPTDIEGKERVFQRELLQAFRLLDDYDKSAVIDLAKALYKHSTKRAKDMQEENSGKE